jgi:NADPH:quinone reductase-like Zn-dependent oxidoreductase
VPSTMGMDEAAGLYITFPTSYAALVTRANTQEGDWVLVHAAAGGGAFRLPFTPSSHDGPASIH